MNSEAVPVVHGPQDESIGTVSEVRVLIALVFHLVAHP